MSKPTSEKCTCSCFSFLNKRPAKSVSRPKAGRHNPALPVLKTKFRINDVAGIDNTPMQWDKMKVYRYNCPICLRFYSTILILGCCKNYLCHSCLAKLLENHKKHLTLATIKPLDCPLCSNAVTCLTDVDPKENIKFYSDQAQKLYSLFTGQANGKKEDSTQINTEENIVSSVRPKRRRNQQENAPDFTLEDIEIINTLKSRRGMCESENEKGRAHNIRPRVINFSAEIIEPDIEQEWFEESPSKANVPKASIVVNARKQVSFRSWNEKESSAKTTYLSAQSLK